VWTDKGSHIFNLIGRLQADVVWVNTYRFDPTSPFVGHKESGFGREGGLHGFDCLPENFELTYIHPYLVGNH
jgi:aldehyde dehydrogenase (NAD+)